MILDTQNFVRIQKLRKLWLFESAHWKKEKNFFFPLNPKSRPYSFAGWRILCTGSPGMLLLIVSRAKVVTQSREIRTPSRVLICRHASPTPGKSIQNRRGRPELCWFWILPLSRSCLVSWLLTYTLFCYRDVFWKATKGRENTPRTAKRFFW